MDSNISFKADADISAIIGKVRGYDNNHFISSMAPIYE